MERISMFSFAGIFSAWILFYTTKLFIKTRKPKLSKTLPHFIKTSFLYGIFALLAISPLIYHVYNESEGYCKYICKYFERGRDFENDSSVQNRSAIQKAPIEKAKDSRNQTRKYEKVIAIFKALDITNNVNYYFLKEKVIPLKFLIGPLFLLPLALTGLALMLFRRRLFKKEFFLFAVIVSFSLPVYFYMPLGRYRLGMLPVFCISAVYPLIFIANKWRIKAKNSNLKVLLLVIFYMLILYWEIPENFPIRSEDYLAYGMAMEKYSGYNELVEDYFRKAYQINKTSRSAILNFSSKLLDHREHHEAMEVLAPAFKAFPKDRKIAINYATLLIRTGRAAEAEKILRSFQVPDRPHSKTVYYFQLADSLRLQGKNKEADALYLKSLETANENQMKSINFIRQINLKAAGKTKIKK
jgi:tetratricopeptide (TPR) repeat protein